MSPIKNSKFRSFVLDDFQGSKVSHTTSHEIKLESIRSSVLDNLQGSKVSHAGIHQIKWESILDREFEGEDDHLVAPGVIIMVQDRRPTYL